MNYLLLVTIVLALCLSIAYFLANATPDQTTRSSAVASGATVTASPHITGATPLSANSDAHSGSGKKK